MKRTNSGFTLVELLIVIVIIAILAAISVVAYNGIQQRAINTQISSSVSTVVRQLNMYKIDNGTYPVYGGEHCLAVDNVCTTYDGTLVSTKPWNNKGLMKDLAEYAAPLQSWPASPGEPGHGFGANYMYSASWTYDGKPSPAMITFWLKGKNQDCNIVGGAVSVRANGGTDYTKSKNNKGDAAGGQTRCYLMPSQ